MRTLRVSDFVTPLSDEELAQPPEVAEDAPRLKSNDTLEASLRAFDASGATRIAVFDPADPARQTGWAVYARALATFNTALIEANIEEHR